MGEKNRPEAETCVSGEAEERKGGHGVTRPWFLEPKPPAGPANLQAPHFGRRGKSAGQACRYLMLSQKGNLVKSLLRSHDEAFQAHPWIGKCSRQGPSSFSGAKMLIFERTSKTETDSRTAVRLITFYLQKIKVLSLVS